MNDNKKIEKLGDNGYYKPNLKENDADEGSNENAKDDAQQGQSYGRDSNLYSEKLLKRQLRQHFITIPQTTQDLNEIHENLISVSKNVKYILTAQEQHEDGGKHYHIVITGTKALYVSSIHKKIMEAEGDIKGSIDYQKVKTLKASITYCKKDGKYLEYGTPAKQSECEHQSKIDKVIAEAIENEETKEDNIEFIRKSLPAYWIQYKEQIINALQDKEVKHRKKWKPKVWDTTNQGESIEKRLGDVGVKTRISKTGKQVWEIQFTENGIPGTKYIHSKADLPKEIKEIYND